MKRLWRTLTGVAVTLVMTACGGDGVSEYTPFAKPRVGGNWSTDVTIIDNLGATIHYNTSSTVTAVNDDGSFVYTAIDPLGTSLVVNGATYTYGVVTPTVGFDRIERSYTKTLSGSTNNCIYSPRNAGVPPPWSTGLSWTFSATLTCQPTGGTASVTPLSQTGTIVAIEQITVPAGTFLAVKWRSTLISGAGGSITTQDQTVWRDVVTGISLRQEIVFSRNYTPVVGHAVRQTNVLQTLDF